MKINDTLDWLMSKLLDCKHQDKPVQDKYIVTRVREGLTDQLDKLINGYFTCNRSVYFVCVSCN